MKQRMIIEIETMDGNGTVTAYIEGNGVRSCRTVNSTSHRMAAAISGAAMLSARTVFPPAPATCFPTVPGIEGAWK